MKPILFNTEMVRAILQNSKTMTRRVVKPQPPMPYCHEADGEWFWTSKDTDDDMMDWWPSYEKGLYPPYSPGDILYVREMWAKDPFGDGYIFPTEIGGAGQKWCPSIHMPREAARIFLRVTGVRGERLQSITMSDIQSEGVVPNNVNGGTWQQWQLAYMKPVWDSTIKPADRALYGWEANPWVWVIEFERTEKP